MEEQIGCAHNFSDPNSKLDASFAKLDATFDKINEQIALLKSALQSFIKVRFDIAIDFDALSESSPSSVKEIRMDADAQKVFDKMTKPNFGDVVEDQDDLVVSNEDYSKVPLDNEAPNLFDEMPKSIPSSIVEDQQVLIEVDGENTSKICGEGPLLSFDPEAKCDSIMTVEIYDPLDFGSCIPVMHTYLSLSESPYADILGVCSINHGDRLVVRNKCFFKTLWFCSGYVNFGDWEKHMDSVLIIINELMYDHKIDGMCFIGLIHDPHVLAYFSIDCDVLLLFDPGGHEHMQVDHALNLVLLKETRVLLVGQNSGAEISLVTRPTACCFGPFEFQQVTNGVHVNSTLCYDVEILASVREKEYWNMNSQEHIEAAGENEKGRAWFLTRKYAEGSKMYMKVVCFIDYDCNFNVKCRLNKATLEIHIEVQTSGDLKLIGHNLQMIKNFYNIGNTSMSKVYILLFNYLVPFTSHYLVNWEHAVDSIGFIFDFKCFSWFSIFILERLEIATRAADSSCFSLPMLNSAIYLHINISLREFASNMRIHSPIHICCYFKCTSTGAWYSYEPWFTFVMDGLSIISVCIFTFVDNILAANETFEEEEASSPSLLPNGEGNSERMRIRVELVMWLLVAVAVSILLLSILILKVEARRSFKPMSYTTSCLVLSWPNMCEFAAVFCHKPFGASIKFRTILESLNGADCSCITRYTLCDAMRTELGQVSIEIKQLTASKQDLRAYIYKFIKEGLRQTYSELIMGLMAVTDINTSGTLVFHSLLDNG